jgi:O-antigen/teichoic acid export membrane protein
MKINLAIKKISESPARLLIHFKNDSLFRNSFYLMLSTGVQAFFGFLFWLLSAKLYTPQEIGIGSTLISASTFICYISLLGFNNTLIKFLPLSHKRNEKINSGLVLVFSMAIIFSLSYVMLLPHIAPTLDFVTKSFFLSLVFVILSALSAMNLLTDSVFIAYRAAKYNLFVYTVQSVIKLALPLAVVALGSFGVFASSSLAATLALIMSIFILFRNFDYQPKLSIDKAVVKSIWQFSFSSYISNILNILPTIIVPIIIVNTLGAAQAGYYYLAFMIANLLYAVVYSVSQSFFAEGSYGEVSMKKLFKRALVIIMAIIIPAGIFLAFLGPFILELFGKSYGNEARDAIVVLAISAPFVALYSLSNVVLRIQDKIYSLVFMNLVYAITISGLVFIWAEKGLVWIALAWAIGNLISSLSAMASILHYRRTLNSQAMAN